MNLDIVYSDFMIFFIFMNDMYCNYCIALVLRYDVIMMV